MTNEKRKLTQLLTYGGILPFVGTLILPFIGADFIKLPPSQIVIAYGAVIASFIAGIHWGLYMVKDASINLFIHSNVIALLAWLALLLPAHYGFKVLIGCFIYLWLIDKILTRQSVISDWFMRLRTNASLAVILTLTGHVLILFL